MDELTSPQIRRSTRFPQPFEEISELSGPLQEQHAMHASSPVCPIAPYLQALHCKRELTARVDLRHVDTSLLLLCQVFLMHSFQGPPTFAADDLPARLCHVPHS